MQQYLVYAWDGTDEKALERRMNARPGHFEGARKLKQNGNFIFAGALLNDQQKMIGSTMVVQFETPEELKDWMNAEPYIVNKVWEKVEVHPFKVADV